MDTAALIVDMRYVPDLELLRKALVTTCSETGLDVAELTVALSAREELGEHLFVHLCDDGPGGACDPYMLFMNLELPDEIGAVLSDVIVDIAGNEEPAPWVWTVLREGRSGGWSIYAGLASTADHEWHGEGNRPLKRLAKELKVKDREHLVDSLEFPDTEAVPLSRPFPQSVVEKIRHRLPKLRGDST